MARLPQPGSDKGTWGTVLNDFLSQSLNADGSIKLAALPSLASQGAVTAAAVDTKIATQASTDATLYAPLPKNSRNPLTGYFHIDGYGADRTGATDSATAISAAIAAASAVAGTVYIPSGTYLITSSITLLTNVTILGAGQSQTTLVASATVATALFLGTSGNAVKGVTVSGLSLNGNYSNTSVSISGIQITNGSYVTIKNSGFKNFGLTAVLLQGVGAGGGTPHSSVKNCIIESAGVSNGTNGFGILIKDASSFCIVSGNDISGVAGGMGIGGNGTSGTGYPTHMTITSNTILMATSTTGYEAIGLTSGCTGAIISNNNIYNSQDNGISASADWATITGNNIDGTLNHGIASSGNNTTITGNFIRNVGKQADAAYGGICLSTNKNNTVVSNVILDDQTPSTTAYGVKIVTSGGSHVIALNTITGFLTSAYNGAITTDKILDTTTPTNGYAFNNLYLNNLNAATSGQAIVIANDIRSTGRAFSGNSAVSITTTGAQHTFGSNLPASRPNVGFLAVFGQAADVWQMATTANDNVTTTVVAGQTKTGRLYSNDGITTKDLGDITGKTSTQIDALFLATPTDGTIASGLLSSSPVFLFRRGGKWNSTTASVIA